jgi:hypothetical protein
MAKLHVKWLEEQLKTNMKTSQKLAYEVQDWQLYKFSTINILCHLSVL